MTYSFGKVLIRLQKMIYLSTIFLKLPLTISSSQGNKAFGHKLFGHISRFLYALFQQSSNVKTFSGLVASNLFYENLTLWPRKRPLWRTFFCKYLELLALACLFTTFFTKNLPYISKAI